MVIADPDLVLQQWKSDFQGLHNSNDDDVVQEPELDSPPPVDTTLEDSISLEEIKLAVHLAKCGKAPGWDALLAEVLKNNTAIILLHHMFNVYFNHGIVAESWVCSIVKPTPKIETTDLCDPLNNILLWCASPRFLGNTPIHDI